MLATTKAKRACARLTYSSSGLQTYFSNSLKIAEGLDGPLNDFSASS
jgi:hypothetical protein